MFFVSTLLRFVFFLFSLFRFTLYFTPKYPFFHATSHVVWFKHPNILHVVFGKIVWVVYEIYFVKKKDSSVKSPHNCVWNRKHSPHVFPPNKNTFPTPNGEREGWKYLGITRCHSRHELSREYDKRCFIDSQPDMLSRWSGAPFAFKDSMIHWVLQFALRIAACCVLHRCTSQEIRR